MTSSHNPFRSPAVTPTPTGTTTPSNSSSAGRSSSNGGSTQAQSDSGSGSRPAPIDTSVSDILSEELPPAYTPSPNFYEGEATLEVGPRRPFQQPARIPPQNTSQFPPQSWAVPPQPSGASNWSGQPGLTQQHYHTTAYAPPHPPPPVHPDIAGVSRPSSTPPTRMSDFTRDFYAAGGGDSGLYGGASAQYQNGHAGASSSSSGPRYAPPSGEPPNRSEKAGVSSPRSSGPSASSSSSNGVPDDGRPTDRPVPGHPLLRQGKVLVYPHGYECQKCRNTGYKNFDPSHPCPRCWEKYSKPYAGAITYATWTSDSTPPSSSSFQRPLPNFRPPQSSLHQASSSWSGPLSGLARAATTSRASTPYGSGYPGASARVIPIAGGALPMGPYLDRLGAGPATGSGFPPNSWQAGPPPGPAGPAPATVFSPGDPRIGGRMCWRCGGRGKTSFLIFDEETCGICGGIGRTFV
ncbi:hypothetical protein C8Q80DRAFT_128245 [Daedaleopsis nitida]|nr:hypothetical protein C8Q80DRAFT_128245 [Daedaleopsis nitida]